MLIIITHHNQRIRIGIVKLGLFANTYGHKLKQKLDEHLVRVAEQSTLNVAALPNFEGVFNSHIRVKNKDKLQEKSPDNFKWQDEAVVGIEQWRKK